MPREASASPEVNICQVSQSGASSPAPAVPEPHAVPIPARLDWPSIARRLVRAGVVAALGLFLVAAAFAQVSSHSAAPAAPRAHPADAPYGPPTTGSAASILFVPATLDLVSGLNGQGYGGDGGLANASTVQLNFPSGVAYDSSGNLYIADGGNFIVRKIDHTTGDISTFAGTPQTEGFSANGGTALGAQFGTLSGLIIDSSDTLYVSDVSNSVIWKITNAGALSIFAGGGSAPSTCTGSTNSIGDGCLAIDATLSYPTGLAFDAAGNLYIADSHNFLVREVSASTGKISTFAGVVGDAYDMGCPSDLYTTSTGPWTPTEAHLCFPYGIGFDSSGNFYVVESQRPLVRVVTKSTGDITTFAGGGTGTCTGATDSYGDGCPATDATLSYPNGLYVDPANRVYIADQLGGELRIVDASGTISDVLGGNGELVKSSIGLPDTEEILVNESPVGSANGINFVTLDPYGDIIAADADSDAVTSAGSSGGYYFPETTIFTTTTTTSAHAGSSLFPPYILITNPSGVTLNFDADPVITGPFGIVTGAGAGTCTFPGSVAPGESCTLVASFTPTEGDNTKSTGTIVISSNAGNSPNTINLAGVGSGTPTTSATVTPSLLTFTSPVNTASASQMATLTNTGQTAIAISSVGFTGDSPTNFAVTGTTCPTAGGTGTLAVGDACTYSIDFTPSSATTFAAGFQVCISTNSYGCINTTSLSGTGTASTPVTISPSSLAFGGVQISTTSFALAVQVTANSGTLSLAGSSITQTGTNVFFLSTGANACTTSTTLTAGQSCSFYVVYVPQVNGQPNSGTLNIGTTGQTVALSGTGIYFNQSVGSAESAQSLSVLITTAGTPAAISVLTSGVTGLDFTNVFGGTCATGTAYTVGQVCSVDVGFAPTVSGARSGAVILTDSSGDLLGVTYLEGYGNGPQIAYYPVTSLQGGYSTNITAGIAVDAKDDVFYIDASDNLQELTPTATTPTLVASLSSPLASATPNNMVMDGAGNIFVAGAGIVVELPSTGSGTWGTPAAISAAGSIGNVVNVAVDSLGNLYAMVAAGSKVYKIPFSDGAYGTTTALAFPTGYVYEAIASDSAGDLYLLVENDSTGATEVILLPTTNTGYGSPSTILTTVGKISGGSAIAVDDNGNLFVSGLTVSTNGAVYFIPNAGSSGYGTPVELDQGLLGSLAIDGADNVFAMQANLGDEAEITEVPMATAPTLAFTSTAVGSTSSNSPQTATVVNIGNQDLYFDEVQYPTDYPENNNDDSLCNAEFPVGPGATCDVSANFTPTVSGTLNEDATLSDDNLNGDGAQQLVPMTGIATSTGGAATLTGISFGNQTEGVASAAMTATLSNTSSSASLSITGITITGANASDFTLSTGSGACSTTTALAAGKSCLIYVVFTPSTAAAEAATLNVADNATGSPQTAALTGTGTAGALTITPTSLIFPSQTENTTSAPMTLTFKNTGNGILGFAGVPGQSDSADGFCDGACLITGDFAVSGGTCNFTSLTPGSSCTLTITFTPTATGSLTGVLTVATLNPAGTSSTQEQVPLSGTGGAPAAPAVTLSPTSLAFGDEEVNTTSAAQSVTVTNSGTATLNIISISLTEPSEDDGVVNGRGLPSSLGGAGHPAQLTIRSSPDYAATTTCGSTLAAGANCTISVTFDPSTTGSLPGTLYVQDNAANSPQSVSLSGTGVTGGSFTVASPTPPQTINSGGSAQYTINVAVTPSGDIFPNQVTLTAAGLPPGATASFSPPQVVPGTGTVTSTMNVQTSTQASALAPFSRGSRWPIIPSSLALACCGAWAGFRRRHRERLSRYFALVLFLASLGAATFGLMGCGAGFAQIKPTTYTITVTGTSGESTASTTVQLTVE
jgi:trimeric autotransporter adhesin